LASLAGLLALLAQVAATLVPMPPAPAFAARVYPAALSGHHEHDGQAGTPEHHSHHLKIDCQICFTLAHAGRFLPPVPAALPPMAAPAASFELVLAETSALRRIHSSAQPRAPPFAA
jgi:hypothetical protein